VIKKRIEAVIIGATIGLCVGALLSIFVPFPATDVCIVMTTMGGGAAWGYVTR
jgi:hypothetical protein